MQIIQGGKEPDPEPEDTFLKDLLLTRAQIETMLIQKQITREQFEKLIGEVMPYAHN
jgi:hypothetical protein